MSVLPFFPEGYAPRRATWWMDAADAFWRYLNNLVENVDGSSRRQPTRQTDFVLKLWLSTVTCAGLVTKQDETSRTQEAVPKQISNPFSRKRVHFFGKRTHKNMYPLPSKWMLVFLLQILYILREECTLFQKKTWSILAGLDYKACTWLRYFLPIFTKIAVRQRVGGRGAAEGNSKPCKPFSPTQYNLPKILDANETP